MEKAIIGDVLRKRIKEKKYTQQKFAEITGVKYSTLKKYMSGKAAYSYELLLVFSKHLDCSVDYLLGLSKSPIKEHHEISEQTRLSEEAIQQIVKYASHYDDEYEGRRYIKCLDMMLCEDGMFSSICDFLIASRFVNDMAQGFTDMMQKPIYENPAVKKMGIEEDKRISLENQQMINVVCKLKDMKAKMTPEFIAELKELDTEEEYNRGMEKISEVLMKMFPYMSLPTSTESAKGITKRNN